VAADRRLRIVEGGRRRANHCGDGDRANFTRFLATARKLGRLKIPPGFIRRTKLDAPMTSAAENSPMTECRCFTPPLNRDDFDSKWIGVDETDGRFGEVSIETCNHCGGKCIHYFVEYEAVTASGRWFRGLITPEIEPTVTPNNAVALLESLPWHLYGGSYFRSAWAKGTGAIHVGI
jgi:hypothetical protein